MALYSERARSFLGTAHKKEHLMWDPYADFESTTLPNGLTIHAAHWKGRPWESVGFLLHSGAQHDPKSREGLAHFVEHMVSANTIATPTGISSLFEEVGGSVMLGETGYPYTRYGFFAPADKAFLAQALKVFGHMLLSAKLRDHIERERKIIIGEFNRRFPIQFRYDLEMRKHAALYRNHWLEGFVRPLGNPESIGDITEQDLQSYYNTHYTPANMSVVAVGGMSLETLTQLFSESSFGMRKKGRRTQLPQPLSSLPNPRETRTVCELSKIVTSHIEVAGYETTASIPGTVHEQVIQVMKHMFDEVLHEEIREKRSWTYSIGSSYHNFLDLYQFSISCGVLALQAVDYVEEAIEACIDSMSSQHELFEQTKRRMHASTLMVDTNGKKLCDGALHDLATYQRIVSLSEEREELSQVTLEEIRQALEWLQPTRRWTLIAKP